MPAFFLISSDGCLAVGAAETSRPRPPAVSERLQEKKESGPAPNCTSAACSHCRHWRDGGWAIALFLWNTHTHNGGKTSRSSCIAGCIYLQATVLCDWSSDTVAVSTKNSTCTFGSRGFTESNSSRHLSLASSFAVPLSPDRPDGPLRFPRHQRASGGSAGGGVVLLPQITKRKASCVTALWCSFYQRDTCEREVGGKKFPFPRPGVT